MSNFKDEEGDVQDNILLIDKDGNFKSVQISGGYVQEYKLPIEPRYYKETWDFANKIGECLNHPKNINKQAGRDYTSWIDIIALMREEIDELEQELIDYENRCFESSTRSLEELGDVGACGVLLLDWIKSREGK